MPGLRATGLAHAIVPWRYVLHEGPVPDVPDTEPSRITLICIGEHLGSAHFGGLGELSSEQLGRLPGSFAIKLTSAALDLAARAWAALRAPAPTGLNAIATTTSPELRFLGEAFGRLGREYPSTRDGLSVTERRILGAVAGGAPNAGAAFTSTGAREARPFLGDTWCYDAMIRLARAPSPLLRIAPLGRMVDRHSHLELTVAGRDVLAGREDHMPAGADCDADAGDVLRRQCTSFSHAARENGLSRVYVGWHFR